MRDFHGLVVWQKSHALTLEVYRVTNRFPDDERFGLISQLPRLFLRILLKLVDAEVNWISGGSCKWQWAPQVKSNITSFWPRIWRSAR
jgi:hypothetical protein